MLDRGAGGAGLLALSEGEPVAEHLPRTNQTGFLAASRKAVHAARRRLHEAGCARPNGRTTG